MYQKIDVHTSEKCYPIFIGTDLVNDRTLLRRYIVGKQVLLVSNETVAPIYLSKVLEAFQDKQCDVVILKDGEKFKNEESLFSIYNHLIENHHHRDTTLVALGGGVIGDITGFASATYQRGVQFLQIPTTLLSQVDAAIGGKTAINHPMAKNSIGCFHQPAAVLIDVNTLKTLPSREFYAGFGEIIKYGILSGPDFFNQIIQALAQGLLQNTETLISIIKSCCEIKAQFVEKDEREISGERALLNLGHTFAHALETYTHYEKWLHGEAVGIGLYCAALLSNQVANLDPFWIDEIDKALKNANLPRRIPKDFDITALSKCMLMDKKIINKTIRFILIREPGNCYIENNISMDQLQGVLEAAKG